MFQNSPHLSDEINSNIAKSEMDGGVFVDKLPVGAMLQIQTRNTLYTLEKREDGTYLHGNARFCPVPTKATIHGSTWGGSMLKMGFVGRGMFMEFSTDIHHSITTTEIQELTEVPAA